MLSEEGKGNNVLMIVPLPEPCTWHWLSQKYWEGHPVICKTEVGHSLSVFRFV